MFTVTTYYKNRKALVEVAATFAEAMEMTRKHMQKGALVSEFGR